jgi:hypothetical protein
MPFVNKNNTSIIIFIFFVSFTLMTQQLGIASEALAESESQSINSLILLNNLTTQLADEGKLPPTKLARSYALVHVAIHDSLLTSKRHDIKHLPEISVLAGSASEVLSYLFPNNSRLIMEIENAQIQAIRGYDNDSITSGNELGHMIAKDIIRYARNDGSNVFSTTSLPMRSQCTWNGFAPVTPYAGHWKTFILSAGSEIQPLPPAPCQSEEDLKNIREVVEVSRNRTLDQITAVRYWGDTLPPSIWNNILNEELKGRHLSLFAAVRASAYLNVAIYDACISTWYTKYTYWTARPFQRIDNLTTVIPTPNFPGYTSGHATMSAAASEVLSELFQNQTEAFHNMANQAKMSRLWAGIHFTQDNERGAAIGTQIGKRAVNDMRAPLHTFIYLEN